MTTALDRPTEYTPRTPSLNDTGAPVLGLVNLVLRQLKLILTLAVLFGGLAFAYAFTRPRMYTAAASFLLQAPKLSGNVPGLAAQLGVSLPSTDPAQSPAFYVETIKSRGILTALTDTTFTYPDGRGGNVSRRLADAYRIRERQPALRREDLLEKLTTVIDVRQSVKTGVVSFSVDAPAPHLAAAIATAILRELTHFNMQRRQSQAAAERRFTQKRLAEVGAELRDSERRLEAFLAQNRSIANSPTLRFQQERLTREVELRRSLYMSLAQSFEQARIDEVRDTPQLTVLQAPEVPARASSRFVLGKAVVAAMFGALLGLLLGYSRERMGSAAASSSQEVLEFNRLRLAARDALRRRLGTRAMRERA